MRIALAALIGALTVQPAGAEALPDGFARLSEVAPEIRQDMRYAGPFNFTGRRVPGYEAPACLLRREAAEALKTAQAKLAAEGFGLKVYDCYRPVRAVQALVAWSKRPGEEELKPVFYPEVDKGRLVALGYLAARSSHSKGLAVDIGLVRAGDPDQAATGGRCDGPFAARAAESSLDLGTAYDCFSPRSATVVAGLSAEARRNRERLVAAMASAGFRNYAKEWWHFEYGARGGGTAYDFPVR